MSLHKARDWWDFCGLKIKNQFYTEEAIFNQTFLSSLLILNFFIQLRFYVYIIN